MGSSTTFENQNDARCLNEEEYSLTRGKATCVLEIKNIGGKAIGYYQVYNSDHQQIPYNTKYQYQYHVYTSESECKKQSQSSLVAVESQFASLVVLLFGFVILLVFALPFCFFIRRKRQQHEDIRMIRM